MPQSLLNIAIGTAQLAGEVVLEYYQARNFTQKTKADNSPVTSADLAANKVIMQQLAKLTPDIPIISEEVGAVAHEQRQHWHRYWLLDPIDGTGEFILGSGDFAVNIALVEQGKPTIGVIHAPEHKLTYFAQQDYGAFKDNGVTRHRMLVKPFEPNRVIKVAISRRQELTLIRQYLSNEFQYEFIALGSCSLKNCLIAEGGADCYLRIGPTGEWDTGASQCILEQAGGAIVSSDYQPLSYNQRDSLMNPDFISLGDQAFDWQNIIRSHATKRNY